MHLGSGLESVSDDILAIIISNILGCRRINLPHSSSKEDDTYVRVGRIRKISIEQSDAMKLHPDGAGEGGHATL